MFVLLLLKIFDLKWKLPGIFQVLLLMKNSRRVTSCRFVLGGVTQSLCRDSLLVCSVKALKWCLFPMCAWRRGSLSRFSISRSTDWPGSPRVKTLHKQFLSVAAFSHRFWLIKVPPWSYLSRVLCMLSCEAYGACSFLHWGKSITGLPVGRKKTRL